MPTRAKVFEYAAEVDRAGRMTVPGGAQIEPPEGWSADHLLLAALVRCSIDSLTYHARRAGHEVAAQGQAQGTITRRDAGGPVRVRRDRRAHRGAADARARTIADELTAKAERDCFVGASLKLKPEYEWQLRDGDSTTVEAVRARFTALQRPLAFFDGPGGTQVPDSVIDAIAGYLRSSNANTGGPFATSYATDALVARAHEAAAGFLNATADEVRSART